MSRDEQYVVLSWVYDVPGFQRYSFATLRQAEELWPHVEWLQTCPSTQRAAAIVEELNLRDTLGRPDRFAFASDGTEESRTQRHQGLYRIAWVLATSSLF